MTDPTRPVPKPPRTRREHGQDDDDKPIGYVPTPAGLNWLAIRRRQNPPGEQP